MKTKVYQQVLQVRNFFEVEYNFPGLVSAGITCDVYVNFEPKMNEDISTHIPIITQTGPITIPVRCLRKRATLSLSSPVVSFQVRLTDEPGGPIQEIRGHGHVSDKVDTLLCGQSSPSWRM